MLRTSIMRRDLPMTTGIVLLVATVIVVLNLLVDLTCSMLDPRVRRALAPARA